jgi:hypothetical protein
LLAVFVLTSLFAFYPVTDTDIWWHLATAREMISHHVFLHQDPFSYTPLLNQWINLHWLYQLLVYSVYVSLGLFGVIAIKALFFGAAATIAFLVTNGEQRPLLRLSIFVFFTFQVRYLMLDRPVMITVLFMVIFFYALEHFRTFKQSRWLFVLLLVQILWVNSQGLSAVGLAIAGCFFIEALFESSSRARYLALLIVGLVLCGLANPYGTDGFALPLKLFTRIVPSADNIYSMNISENMPLRYLHGSEMHFAYTSLFMACLIIVSIWFNRKNFRISHLLLFVAFALLCTMALRNVLLFVFMGLMLVNWNISNVPVPVKEQRYKNITAPLLVLLIILLCFFHVKMLLGCRGLNGLSPFRVPDKAVSYLKANPISGNCFNADRYGGYMLWTLYPEKKVFIDGRFTIRPVKVFQEYLDALDKPETFPALAQKYDITHVLLPVSVFERFVPLVKMLYKNQEWDLLYVDGSSILFALSGMGGTPPLSLNNAKDIAAIKDAINEHWNKNALVRNEALKYLKNLDGL